MKMRLIDADELLKHKNDHETISTHLIFNAPTVDAEPVIRCQNCKHNKTFKCPLYTEHYSASYGYSVESRNAPDDFCSRAERKEE